MTSFFFRLVYRRSLIPSMPGYSFECHLMYLRSEEQSVLDMLPLVSCIFSTVTPSAEFLTFVLLPLRTQSAAAHLPYPSRTNGIRRNVLDGSAGLL
jgi:hypothetical protein